MSAAEIQARLRANRCKTSSVFFRDLWSVLTSDLPKSPKFTRLAILAFADATGDALGTAHPGIDTIAALTGQSRRNALRDTALLEARGWLEKSARGGHLTTECILRIPPQTIAELNGLLQLGVTPMSPLGVTPMSPNLHRGSAQPIGPVEESEPADSFPLKSAGAGFGGDGIEVGIERARQLASDLRALDDNHVLSGRLFTQTAYAELAAIAEQFGEARVRAAVNSFLASDRTGDPKRQGHVQYWRYFRIAIEKERLQCIRVE